MSNLIAVIDETGTTNIPTPSHSDDFGVGGLIFPKTSLPLIVATSKQIQSVVAKQDYKYKHIRDNPDARALVLELLNSSKAQLQVYGFYSASRSILDETARSDAAAGFYGTRTHTRATQDTHKPRELLDSFIEFSAPCLAAYAADKGEPIEVYLDRRTDMDAITEKWNSYLEVVAAYRRPPKADTLARLCGEATGELTSAARLAGVLAGDVRLFFQHYGERVWQHLDASGLKTTTDPHFDSATGRMRVTGTPRVATINESLGAPTESQRILLRKYTKRLANGILSFAAPSGILGHLVCEHGSCWHVHQLPD